MVPTWVIIAPSVVGFLIFAWLLFKRPPTDEKTAEEEKMTPSRKAMEIAASCWCDPRTDNTSMDPILATVFAEQVDRYIEALIWCSGAADFAPEGRAGKQWLKIQKELVV